MGELFTPEEKEKARRQLEIELKAREKQNQPRRMINTYGTKMFSKNSRVAEKLMKGKHITNPEFKEKTS